MKTKEYVGNVFCSGSDDIPSENDMPFSKTYSATYHGNSDLTDFYTWLVDSDDRLYRYWVFKKIYTPYEQSAKFMDESVFEDSTCSMGYIAEAIELPDGDILLGFRNPDIEDKYIEYFKLSEIRLVYCESDQPDYIDCEEEYEDY